MTDVYYRDYPLLAKYIFKGNDEQWASYLANKRASYERHLRRLAIRKQGRRQMRLFS